jgi:hypothetical protein
MALLKGERPTVTITPSSIKDDSLYAISFFLFAFLQETWTLVNSLSLFFFFLFQKIINACTQIFCFFVFFNLQQLEYLYDCQLSFTCLSMVFKCQSLLEQARDWSCSPVSGVAGPKRLVLNAITNNLNSSSRRFVLTA